MQVLHRLVQIRVVGHTIIEVHLQIEDVVARVGGGEKLEAVVGLCNLHVLTELHDLRLHLGHFLCFDGLGEIRLRLSILSLDGFPTGFVHLVLIREAHLGADIQIIVAVIFVGHRHHFFLGDGLQTLGFGPILLQALSIHLQFKEKT